MWRISEVKSDGWSNLKKYYWAAVLVSLVAAILGSGSGGGSIGGVIGKIGDLDEIIGMFLDKSIALISLSIILPIILLILAAGAAVDIFIGGPMLVGRCRFYCESRAREGSAGIERVFWSFGCGSYLNIVKIMFFKNLRLFLWTLLLVIPGIYKSYEYAMIPYILSENPDMDSRDVFAASKEMMEGNRFHLFLTQLSFVGWDILGVLLCCIGTIFVRPYYEAVETEVYMRLRGGDTVKTDGEMEVIPVKEDENDAGY